VIRPTKEYPNNYAYAIRHNVICCGEWQKHKLNYYYKWAYYLCEAGLSYYNIIATKTKYRNGLNAAPDIMILGQSIFPALSQIFKKMR